MVFCLFFSVHSFISVLSLLRPVIFLRKVDSCHRWEGPKILYADHFDQLLTKSKTIRRKSEQKWNRHGEPMFPNNTVA